MYRYWNDETNEFDLRILLDLPPGCILVSDGNGNPFWIKESVYLKGYQAMNELDVGRKC
jgi:hypothetical protein